MKKIFLFAAAVATALTVNAASFAGFSAIDNHLGLQIMNNDLIQDQTNVTVDQASSFDATNPKYEIKLVEGGVEGTFTMGGVTFAYTNSTAGTVAFKTYGTYIQPNGKDREIRIPAASGEKVTINLIENCAGVLVNGVSTDLVAGDNELTAGSDGIILKTASSKPKIAAILPVVGQGIKDINVVEKATKRFENGQMVIIKNGVKYNVIGVQL